MATATKRASHHVIAQVLWDMRYPLSNLVSESSLNDIKFI